eukprot:g2826.t1
MQMHSPRIQSPPSPARVLQAHPDEPTVERLVHLAEELHTRVHDQAELATSRGAKCARLEAQMAVLRRENAGLHVEIEKLNSRAATRRHDIQKTREEVRALVDRFREAQQESALRVQAEAERSSLTEASLAEETARAETAEAQLAACRAELSDSARVIEALRSREGQSRALHTSELENEQLSTRAWQARVDELEKQLQKSADLVNERTRERDQLRDKIEIVKKEFREAIVMGESRSGEQKEMIAQLQAELLSRKTMVEHVEAKCSSDLVESRGNEAKLQVEIGKLKQVCAVSEEKIKVYVGTIENLQHQNAKYKTEASSLREELSLLIGKHQDLVLTLQTKYEKKLRDEVQARAAAQRALERYEDDVRMQEKTIALAEAKVGLLSGER